MSENCDLAQMYDCFERAIVGKKFLLVLDNVWDQEGLWQKWQDLKSLLALGADGSRVLLTTRNKKVARMMDCVNPYVLGDLTKYHSWLLFQKIAFRQCQDPSLEAIGKEIVNMCPNVPLVIRSIGGLLAGKCTVMEWLSFRDDQLANFSAYGRDIMQTLKLSYDQLDDKLKLCIAYCSLFPKRHLYSKDTMIQIWISLGYIEPSYERQRLEDAAEECILMLATQGFFITYICNNIYEMHDLMHDLVLSIAGFKYKRVVAGECEIDERVRHLSVSLTELENEEFTNALPLILKLKHLQSLWISSTIYNLPHLHISKEIFNTFPRLRILSLSELGINKVPSSLGELITLRYLDLLGNPITHLPNSITKLVELLALNVSCCTRLYEFPKGIKKLVKLRHIMNFECPAPIPKEVVSLTQLQTLKDFPIEFSERFPIEAICGLEELNIIINRVTHNNFKIIVTGDANSRCLKADKEECKINCNRKHLELRFEEGSTIGDEMVLEAFQPNSNLEKLAIKGYKGERLPTWMNKDGTHYFENLVSIDLYDLEGCKSIGSFGRLLHLEYLSCEGLMKVEYMEEIWYGGTTHNAPLFPSLEELWLKGMPKLKEWYNKVSSSNTSSPIQDNLLLVTLLGFPKLRVLHVTNMEIVISMTREFRGFSSLEKLEVYNCKDIKAIPGGIPNLSNLKQLELFNCCEELKERCQKPNGEDWPIIKHIPHVKISLYDF